MFIRRLILFLYLFCFHHNLECLAGSFLITPMVGLSNASYQPLNIEKTPNYYGPEFSCLITYYSLDILENGLLLTHFSGIHPAKEKPKINMSTVAWYTGVLKAKIINLGLIAGYSFLERSGESISLDPESTAEGNTFGFSIGTIQKGKGLSFWRISLDYLQSNLILAGSSILASSSSRKLDKFQIRLGYTHM